MTDIQSLWAPGADDSLFWEYCSREELRFQTCTACGISRHPPHPVCSRCGSTDFEYRPAPETGSLYSFTVVRTAAHKAFADQLPYCLGIVVFSGLPEIKLVTRILDADPQALAIGMPLRLVWRRHGPKLVLPCFAPEEQAV